jgi:site-specific DNA-methyltransferase (adenine-specific)
MRGSETARKAPVDLALSSAEDFWRTLQDESVHLLVLDPPYHRVLAEDWDRQWATDDAYLEWLGGHLDEARRVIAANGSLYLFSGAALSDRISAELIRPRFSKLADVVWAKAEADLRRGDPRRTQWEAISKTGLRSWLPTTERVIFAEHHGADQVALDASGYASKCAGLRGSVFEPLRAYLDGERKAAGVSKAEVNGACGFSPTSGGMASRHYFSPSLWCLPTAEHYASMQELFNRQGGEHLRREYEDLRREYEDLRRPFNVDATVPHSDVWTYATVPASPDRHPAEKPLDMIRDIINASSRPGDLVVDAFSGRATTACACVDTGRAFRGCERDPEIHEAALDRIEKHLALRDRRQVERRRTASGFDGPLFE